jgi:SAM-dependent methyltransferase
MGADATVPRLVGYFEWHEQPGYFRDITRHFEESAELLDVGCGTGWLGQHFPNYTGIDGSADAVAAAHEKGREIVHGDVEEPLPFADASFDGVVLKDLLEHVREPTSVVAEALRVLRPGGRVFASSPDAQRWVWDDYTHRRPFTRKAFRLLFRDAGFEVEQVGYESVMPGTSIVSARTRSNRRPAPLRAAAWLPVVRRNVWLVARKP